MTKKMHFRATPKNKISACGMVSMAFNRKYMTLLIYEVTCKRCMATHNFKKHVAVIESLIKSGV